MVIIIMHRIVLIVVINCLMNNYLIIIIGPTAIGKTALSIKLAQHFNCNIISSDSRQFYKEMTIGTAVPNNDELSSAKHYFIQNKSIFDNYSVGNFETEAIQLLENLFKKNNIQVLVGGSGLYIDAILKGFDVFPEIDSKIRNEINVEYNKNGIEFLQNKLKELDEEYYKKLQKHNQQTLQNPQRMKRFVEVCMGTQKPYSSFIGKQKSKRIFKPIIIGLNAEREIINNRINQRVDFMMANGLLDEAVKLYPYKNVNALQTVGYKELFEYLDKSISLDDAVEQIKKNTRRFAKRQLTWFKKNENAIWFNYLTPSKEIINYLELQTQSL